MMGYFKPLRRKIGVLTLVATIFMACCWVRSLFVRDLVIFSYGKPTWELFESGYGCLVWARNYDQGPMWFPPSWEVDKTSEAKSPLNDPQLEWEWRILGFGVAKYPMGPGRMIPCWSIVVPLTSLSGWLLLSKPRAKIEPTISPAAENP